MKFKWKLSCAPIFWPSVPTTSFLCRIKLEAEGRGRGIFLLSVPSGRVQGRGRGAEGRKEGGCVVCVAWWRVEWPTNFRIFGYWNDLSRERIFPHSNMLQYLTRITYVAKLGSYKTSKWTIVKQNIHWLDRDSNHEVYTLYQTLVKTASGSGCLSYVFYGFRFTMAHFEALMLNPSFKDIWIRNCMN